MKIRFCKKDDIGAVMHFIDQHWSKGHIMATSQPLMDWQHRGTEGRGYDYVVAMKGEEVFGCLGFILTSRFDSGLRETNTIWLALWKAREDAPTGLGLQMLGFLQKQIPHQIIGTVGINAQVAKLYQALGYKVQTMSQHYVLHPEREDFQVAKVPSGATRLAAQIDRKSKLRLSKLDSESLLALQPLFDKDWPAGWLPRKTPVFFQTRYLEHPFYEYMIYAIEREGVAQGLLVTRLCEVQGNRTLRIVDGFLPDAALPGLALPLQQLLVEQDAECADLFQSGLDQEALTASGLLLVDELEGDVVIPNYYGPFLRKNVSITWAFKVRPEQHLVAFKADADQDRPNHLEA